MVNEEFIYEVLSKCWTKAQIRSKLSAYSDVEKVIALKKLTNPFEFEMYKEESHKLYHLKKRLEMKESRLEAGDQSEEVGLKGLRERVERIEESIFKYERRIIEGYTPPVRNVPNIDMGKFKEDSDSPREEYEGEDYFGDDTMSELESYQIEAQDKKMNYTRNALECLEDWFDEGHEDINSSIYNNRQWQSLDSEERMEREKRLTPIKQTVTRLINESPGLLEDTVLYMGSRHFDVTSVVGDRISFKGYLSTSFQKSVAKDFAEDFEEGNITFVYKILAPKGTKGICGESREILNPNRHEHEYLLGRNTSATIMDIDYDNYEITILLDDPV